MPIHLCIGHTNARLAGMSTLWAMFFMYPGYEGMLDIGVCVVKKWPVVATDHRIYSQLIDGVVLLIELEE